ncbi:MAG TPA: hypothetical protein ENO24_01180, partial [Chloroflexi bacterium]|nr:hypothetical protein [Chloroflexota bacterium]
MRPEEVKRRFRALKAGLESEAISEQEFDTELERFVFQDESGQYWTIGAQTGQWYRYEDGEWVQGQPPPVLEPVEREMERPQERQEEGAHSRSALPRLLLVALASLVFIACLVAVAVASYRLGRASMTAPGPTPSLAPAILASPCPTVQPTSSPTAATEETPGPEVASPTVTATVETSSQTAVSQPTATPSLAPSSPSAGVEGFAHPAPLLVEPEDGAERGPGYYAILKWEPVVGLTEDEY